MSVSTLAAEGAPLSFLERMLYIYFVAHTLDQ